MRAQNETPSEISLFNSVETPAIEQYPRLRSLENFDGSEVEFVLRDDTYVLSSLRTALPENFHMADRFFFGLWKKVDGKLTPTGFVEFNGDPEHKHIDGVNARAHISSFMSDITWKFLPEKMTINEQTQKFIDFAKDFYTEIGLGMKIDPPGEKLGTILFTASLAVMQGAGFETLEIYRDETKSKSIKLTPTDTGLLEPTILESFYAKYSTEGVRTHIDGEDGGPEQTRLRMPTTLSSMHLSILDQYFG